MNPITLNSPGSRAFMMGNDAIARGLLEGGVQYCAAYPGNPSSEILERLADAAVDLQIYAEWSVNEKVAIEGAAAASLAGVRSMASMKQNGVNVSSDFITNLALSGVKAGMLLITCDDPGAVSSTNEEDARFIARLADLPMLEPSTPQEAMEMARFGLELSEQLGSLCVLRTVTRLCHSRSAVSLGSLPEKRRVPRFDTSVTWRTFPVAPRHAKMHRNLEQAESLFENSPFNTYEGPEEAELLIFAAGNTYLFCQEALEILDLESRVGLAKLGTVWPLPRRWVLNQMRRSRRILFVEDVDPFVEDGIKALYAQVCSDVGVRFFYGKADGALPGEGETNPDVVMEAVRKIRSLEKPTAEDIYRRGVRERTEELIPPRDLGFCPGCPHRASFWSIKNALKLDSRDGFVSGDIGCYTLSLMPTGFSQSKSVHCMGSGLGVAAGFAKLRGQGFDQPVIAVVGDSTFYHSGIAPLVDAVHHNASCLLILLDNGATAMTGFQPHPGLEKNATGAEARAVDLEALCEAAGASVVVQDPFDMTETRDAIYRLLQQDGGLRVLILRRTCALLQRRLGGFPYRMRVEPSRCLSEECGCNRFCTRVFRCPGLYVDPITGKTSVDDVICVGCGACVEICPQGAIIREARCDDAA